MLNTIIITIALIILVSLLSCFIFRKKVKKPKDKDEFIEMINLKEVNEQEQKKEEQKQENNIQNEVIENNEENIEEIKEEIKSE